MQGRAYARRYHARQEAQNSAPPVRKLSPKQRPTGQERSMQCSGRDEGGDGQGEVRVPADLQAVSAQRLDPRGRGG